MKMFRDWPGLISILPIAQHLHTEVKSIYFGGKTQGYTRRYGRYTGHKPRHQVSHSEALVIEN